MNVKKLVLYYGIASSIIGVRTHCFDWKEGDEIITNGEKTEVYAVFDYTTENMMYLATMFKIFNTKTSMPLLKGFKVRPEDEDDILDNMDILEYVDKHELLAEMVCNGDTVKKRQWSDYDKQLDFMEEIASRLKES